MSGLGREFTATRWQSNPFQMIATLILGIWAVLQIARGMTADTVLETELDRHAQLMLSSTNLFGALICLTGLHMRDWESALWVEVIGYVSLVGSLGIYLYLVAEKTGEVFNTSPGVGLSWAFVLASVVRTTQILRLKKAERHADELGRLVARMKTDHPGPDVADAGGGDV